MARALLEFLYTGELRRPLDMSSPLPYELRAAAKSYGVPRLEALCAEAISLGSDHMGETEQDTAMEKVNVWGQVRSYDAGDETGAYPKRVFLYSMSMLQSKKVAESPNDDPGIVIPPKLCTVLVG